MKVTLIGLSGCVAPQDEFGTLRDTRMARASWQYFVDERVALERRGETTRQVKDWPTFWRARIAALRSRRDGHPTQQNAEAYVAYIVETRRAAGLPEL